MNYLRRYKKALFIAGAILLSTVVGVAVYYYTNADAVVKGVVKSGSAVDLLVPEALAGESTGAVNILVASNSIDDPGHGGAELTDSIIIASYKLDMRQLTLLSIPRDLYVDVNGGYMKINAAYTYGGMDTLKQNVQEVTGLTINHSVLINYQAFKQMIDAVGGIDVTIAADDPRGINDPMIGYSITNGVHHLDSADALLLARCRNDPTYDGRVAYGLSGGDFDRAANQRKIVEALLAKVNDGTTLANPAALQSLIEGLSGNVTSDLTVGQLRRLYDISKTVSSQKSIGLQGDSTQMLLANYNTAAAGDTLIPASGIGNYDGFKQYIMQQLEKGTPAS